MVLFQMGWFYSRIYHRVILWAWSLFPQCIQCGFVWTDGKFPAGCKNQWDGGEGGTETRFNIGTYRRTKKWWQRQAQQPASNTCKGKIFPERCPEIKSRTKSGVWGCWNIFLSNSGCPAECDLIFLSEFSAEFWGRVANKNLSPHSGWRLWQIWGLVAFGVGRSLTEIGHVLQKFLIFSSSLVPNPNLGFFLSFCS